MKVEIKNARVELEVEDGSSILYLNGKAIPITRDVGVALIFGDKVVQPATTKPAEPVKKKTGPQSAAARKKLSDALKAYHADKRQKLQRSGKGKFNGKSHMNGASSHTN